jgi:hypothetical protein
MVNGFNRKHACHNDVRVECSPRSNAYATEEEMAQYSATLPNGDVVPPSVEYFIEAEDSAANQASHPPAGAGAPHKFAVKAKDGGGNGGGNDGTGDTGGGGIGAFLGSPTGLLLLVGLVAAVVAMAATVMMMRRRKRPPASAHPSPGPQYPNYSPVADAPYPQQGAAGPHQGAEWSP